MDNTPFAVRLPPELNYHLHLASAHHGLSRSEYARIALTVALNAEPVVTPQLARNMAAMARGKKKDKSAKNADLVDA